MHNEYTQLSVVEIDPTLYRVQCRITGMIVGYLSKGGLWVGTFREMAVGSQTQIVARIVDRSLWFVVGREGEQIFNSANEALHALRDYWLTQRIAIEQELKMQKNDGKLALAQCASVKSIMPEYRRVVRKERKENALKTWMNKVYGGLVR